MIEKSHLIYIHGFNSSPASTKARLIRQAVQQQPQFEFHVPGLPYDPARAMEILEGLLDQLSAARVGLVGSSLGGFYGTFVAEKYNLPLVLVNPATRPYELLADYLGENENIYTGEKYIFTEQHVQVLKNLDVEKPSRLERYLLLVQTGDEVLDYRQAVNKYAGCRQIVEPGGDHSFQNFQQHLPTILEFLQ